MTKEKILKAIGTDAWDKIKKLAFGEQSAGEMTEALLADGTEIMYEGKLAVGTLVMILTPEGEMPIADGKYELEDGTRFTTKKGAIETIAPAADTKSAQKPASGAVKQASDLKEKIEMMYKQHEENAVELAAIKKQFSTMQADNKALRQNLGKISRVLEILVENTPDEPMRNRQFARNSNGPTKAERIAALLKS